MRGKKPKAQTNIQVQLAAREYAHLIIHKHMAEFQILNVNVGGGGTQRRFPRHITSSRQFQNVSHNRTCILKSAKCSIQLFTHFYKSFTILFVETAKYLNSKQIYAHFDVN